MNTRNDTTTTTTGAQVFRLADTLEAAGLGGTEPIRAAQALLATLRRLPGGDDPDHQAAHNLMVIQMVRAGHGEGLLATAGPDAAMLILARLVYAGALDGEIAEVLRGWERRREVGR